MLGRGRGGGDGGDGEGRGAGIESGERFKCMKREALDGTCNEQGSGWQLDVPSTCKKRAAGWRMQGVGTVNVGDQRIAASTTSSMNGLAYTMEVGAREGDR